MTHIGRRVGSMIVIAAFATAVPGQDKSPTPAEQYQALRKESDRASSSGRVLTDEERLKFVGQAYKRRFEFAVKFLALAEKYPNDPIALDALTQAVWQVNGTPWPVEMVGEDRARSRAFEIIERDHIRSDKLGPLCQRIAYGFCKEYEPFLRAVMTKNPHKEVQAIAAISLGRFLHNRAERVELCRQQPEQAKVFADLFGKEYIAALLTQNPDKAIREAEDVLVKTVTDFGDLKLPGDDTVADRAKGELFEIRFLSVGKDAPDIEGVDQDGQCFKLSDYRGKVVLLDFWSHV